MPEWNIKEQAKLSEKRRKEDLKKKGLADFLTLEEGETRVVFDMDTAPRDREGDFGLQTVFRVAVEKKGKQEAFDLSASMSLTRKILNALAEGHNPMTIIRAGEGRQTRYSVKEMAKKKN